MRIPQEDDDALLADAHRRLPAVASESVSAARWLVEATHVGPPAAMFANLEAFLPEVTKVFRDELLDVSEQRR